MQQTRIVSFSWNDKNDFFVKNFNEKVFKTINPETYEKTEKELLPN